MVDSAVKLDGSIRTAIHDFLQRLPRFQCSRSTCAILALSVATLYLLVVRKLRYRRRDTQARRYGFTTPDSLIHMNVHEAQAIQAEYATLESPQMFFSMSRLGLLKVFGIDTISRTVLPQLSNVQASSFRAVSTSIIMSEIMCNPPSSDRVLSGIARMNYLHSGYIKAGKISNADMLYILSRFALEPVIYAEKYDWRAMTQVEKCATGVFWRDLGMKMEIDYTPLPGSAPGWKDGTHWLDALDSWSRDYELETMAPSTANSKAAYMATHLAAFSFPSAFFRHHARAAMAVFLEPHQRLAMDLPTPSPLHTLAVNTVLMLRRIAYRLLLPPRPKAFYRRRVADKPNRQGRLYDTSYNAYPWYIPPSATWYLSPISWLQWIAGGALPGNEKFEPQGYLVEELGPVRKKGKGTEWMEKDRERIRGLMEGMKGEKREGSGCPFMG